MSKIKYLLALAVLPALAILPASAGAAPPDHAGPPDETPPAERAGEPAERAGEGGEAGLERAAANRERVLIVRACHAERGQTAATLAAFRAEYGTNENGANAFGACVSTRMKAGAPENAGELRALVGEIRARKLAARTCVAELREIGRAEFAERHGTNRNLLNAFGKCVSSEVRARNND